MSSRLLFHSNAVWPARWAMVVFLILYCLLQTAIWLFGLEELFYMLYFLIGAAAGIHALLRLLRLHPVANPAYAAWLRASLWTPDRPLPLGPVYPVWQDAAIIATLTALGCWQVRAAGDASPFDPWLPLSVFGAVYLVLINIIVAFTRRWISCFCFGALWPSFLLAREHSWISLCLLAALIIVACLGLRQSLRAFPWPQVSALKRIESRSFFLQTPIVPPNAIVALGWPFAQLSPKGRPALLSSEASFALALLSGWWVYCLLAAADADISSSFLLFFAGVVASTRVFIYINGAAAPINIWGRLFSGRLIQPGFDVVFLAPLAAFTVAFLGAVAIRHWPFARWALCAATWALTTWILLAAPPSLSAWTLTGRLRFHPPRLTNIQVKPV